jgi:hypothetical protein
MKCPIDYSSSWMKCIFITILYMVFKVLFFFNLFFSKRSMKCHGAMSLKITSYEQIAKCFINVSGVINSYYYQDTPWRKWASLIAIAIKSPINTRNPPIIWCMANDSFKMITANIAVSIG